MRPPTTGIILASGEGSRLKNLCTQLGVPKHLLTIGKETLAGRIATELSQVCDSLLVITNEKDIPLFEAEFARTNLKGSFIGKKKPGFHGDFMVINEYAPTEHFILTVGDLVFPDQVITNFAKKVLNHSNRCYLALDQGQIKKFDLRIVAAALNKSFLHNIMLLNPESFYSVACYFMYYLSQNKVRLNFIETMFNINTEQDYRNAKKYFEVKDPQKDL